MPSSTSFSTDRGSKPGANCHQASNLQIINKQTWVRRMMTSAEEEMKGGAAMVRLLLRGLQEDRVDCENHRA